MKNPAIKKLTINWSDLESAFESSSEINALSEISSYFDTQTGQIFTLDEELRSEARKILAVLEAVDDNAADWTDEDIRNTETYENLAEWMKSSVLAAIQIERADDSTRFEEIPGFNSHEAFTWMEEFIETVQDNKTQARLKAALTQRKPFHNYRAAMEGDRRIERQWQIFEQARRHETVLAWLQSIHVQPLNPGETVNLPPLPELRKIMFTEVRRFVRFARELPGVRRIALIGSLASDKEFPKDIDLLVTVTDDCNLSALATLGRQLAGHMQAHSSGAEIFLANPEGQYLGRTCPWKKCAPGIRRSCDALSCGKRHFLHDDLKAIRLSHTLIQHPAVQLWPEIKALPDCPGDLHEQLIQPLSEDSNR